MSIYDLEQRIRDFINQSRMQSILFQKAVSWNKLCSALDLLSDTQMAIDSYPELSHINNKGSSYLIVYGILQTLLLQQDAVEKIADVLEVRANRPNELSDIRVIRNSAAGHPFAQKEKKKFKTSFINRASVSPKGFELLTVSCDEAGNERCDKTQIISIPHLLETQRSYLSVLLSEIIKTLENQEKERLSGLKPLSRFLPITLEYHFGKIQEAMYDSNVFSLGKPSIQVISRSLQALKKELTYRGEWGVYDTVDFCYQKIEYPLSCLESFFDSSDSISQENAYIYSCFLLSKIIELRKIAKELDSNIPEI